MDLKKRIERLEIVCVDKPTPVIVVDGAPGATTGLLLAAQVVIYDDI